jgi:hypothetical protein
VDATRYRNLSNRSRRKIEQNELKSPRPKAEGDGPKGRDEMPKRHFVATIVVAKNVDHIETKIYRTKLHAGGVAGHSNKKPGFKAGLL